VTSLVNAAAHGTADMGGSWSLNHLV